MRFKQNMMAIGLATAALSAASMVSGTASAYADTVPSGCVGTTTPGYVCTTGATPPDAAEQFGNDVPVGGVIVVIPSQTVGGTYNLVGPTSPYNTGITAPTSICLLVTCVVAGQPIVIPGLPLPYVPVTIPAVTTPQVPINSPVATTLTIWIAPLPIGQLPDDGTLGGRLCEMGGGSTYAGSWQLPTGVGGSHDRRWCTASTFEYPANGLLFLESL